MRIPPSLLLAGVAVAAGTMPAALGAAATPDCAKVGVTELRAASWGGGGQAGLVRVSLTPVRAKAAHHHVVDLYLTTNGTITKRSRRVASRNVPNLGVGSPAVVEMTYRPGAAPVNPGRYFVVARVRGTRDQASVTSASTRNDPVIRWSSVFANAVQETGIRGGDDPPYEGTREYALLTTSLYNVHQAYTGGTQYGITATRPAGSSEQAALHAAANAVLTATFPRYASTFRAEYRRAIAGVKATPAQVAQGAAFGRRVASQVRALRANDGGSATSVPYVPNVPPPYVWLPETYGPFKGAVIGDAADRVTPWVIPDVTTVAKGLQGIATPSNNPAEYARQIEEARTLGALGNTAVTTIRRTAYDTVTGPFWANDAADTYKPYGHLINVALWISLQQRNTLDENIRLFGALGAGFADAATAAWHQKFTHDQPRPYAVIRDYAGIDGNAATVQDPQWKALITPELGGAPAPPFPDYVSGHSTFAGAWGEILTRFSRQQGWQKTTFLVSSQERPQVTRVYDGTVRSSIGYDDNVVDSPYRSASLEDAYSRLPAGVHTRGATRDGHALGVVVAGYAAKVFLGG